MNFYFLKDNVGSVSAFIIGIISFLYVLCELCLNQTLSLTRLYLLMNEEILSKYRKAGRIAKESLNFGISLIKENISYLQVAEKTEEFILNKGGKMAFPVNISVNSVSAHFTPLLNDKNIFKRGDVVKLDVGVHIDGYIGDTALTIEVGTNNHSELIKASRSALNTAISLAKENANLEIIGTAIETIIKSYGFLPISNLTGHAVERYNLHSGKTIPNIKEGNRGQLKKDEVIAIEPFATNGIGRVKDGKNSNIYRFVKEKNCSFDSLKIANFIKENYKGLPFAERWIEKEFGKDKIYFRELVQKGIISSYAILEEVKGGIVSQSEHTVIIKEDSCEVIT